MLIKRYGGHHEETGRIMEKGLWTDHLPQPLRYSLRSATEVITFTSTKGFFLVTEADKGFSALFADQLIELPAAVLIPPSVTALITAENLMSGAVASS